MTIDLHTRTIPVNLELAEGRLFGRLMPYGVSAPVVDELPNGGIDAYIEGFRRGAVARQAAAQEPGVLRRIMLKHEHADGLGYLGPLVSLEERDDAAYGGFMVLPSHRENVAALHELGIREISIEFATRKGGTVVEDGVRWRTDIHLIGAALTAKGAYGSLGAEVLAMRDLNDLVAEQAEAEEAERQRAEAEAADTERLRVEAEAIEQRRRQLDEVDPWLETAKARQAELVERYGCAS